MHLFHVPDLRPGSVQLPEEEAHHARIVLRLREGARVGLLDGRGTRAEATISSLGRIGVEVNIVDRISVPAERIGRIHLAVAPTKQMERFEWMLEKCTEIGVDRITPLLTERSERTSLKYERLQRVLVSAMKQSQRAWLPVLEELTTLDGLLRGASSVQRFFGWCTGERDPFYTSYVPGKEVLLLIGPEGDFTPREAEQLRGHGVIPVSLGEARLRTETAAIMACSWMNAAQQV